MIGFRMINAKNHPYTHEGFDMNKVLIFLITLCYAFQVHAEVHPAEQLMRDTTHTVTQLASEPGADMEAIVREHVLPIIDTKAVTRLAVGKHARKISPEDLNTISILFTELLIRTYSTALKYSSESEISWKRPTIKNRKATVRITISTSGAQAIGVDYSLRLKDDMWKVYDVRVEGISLVTNYRSTFGNTLRSGGAAALISELRKKVER